MRRACFFARLRAGQGRGLVPFKIGRGHGGVQFPAPRLQKGAQFFRFIGLRRGQVARFAEVIPEVVQLQPLILKKLDELPIADADDAAGQRAPGTTGRAQVAGEMPEQRRPRRGR